MGIVIKKYGDLTTPTPAYGGTVRTCFSPLKWLHFLVGLDGSLEKLAGVTGVLKKAVDKSQPLMRWAVKLALARAREKILAAGLGPDGSIQLFVEELDKILADAKKADTEALEDAGEAGHQAHDFIDRVCKAILANDEKRLEELLAHFPEDERACNGAVAALTFLVSHNVRIIKSEFRALSLKHKVCGTGDMLAYVDSCDNRECCQGEPFTDRLSYVDWKTSNYLYVTYLFQGSIYVAATEEEFPELVILDRWILRLDKENATFDPWHAAGREAQAEDLHGFLCCLDLTRALDVTQARVDAVLDVRKQIKAEARAVEKLASDKIRCPKADDYKGVRMTKCLADGAQCLACQKIYVDRRSPPVVQLESEGKL
jgi:hypothetical protein